MQPTDTPLRQYLQILRRQAWLVLLVFGVSFGVAFALVSIRDPVYRASTTLVVGEPRGSLPPVLGSSSVTRTMTNLLESELIARTVIDRLDLSVSSKRFFEKLKVEVLPDTSVVDVSYDSTSRDRALAVVTELSSIFARQVDETLGLRETPGGISSPLPGSGSFSLIVRTFDTPHVEPDPVGPKKGRTLIVAGIIGLVLGVVLGTAREALDSRIRGRKDAEAWFGAPVVGALPRGMRHNFPLGVTKGWRGQRRHARRVASLDLLRARLQFASLGIGGPTILVTSAGFEEGKTGVAANLAVSLARAGKRVVCVDADLGRPGLHRFLDVEEAPGLVHVLEDGADLEEALVPVEITSPSSDGSPPAQVQGRLEVLPAGAGALRSSMVGFLSPEAISGLMERLQERADYVIVDAPPLLVADSFPLALRSNNVLVVARHGRTTKDQAESARLTLEGLKIERVGVVLTDAKSVDGFGSVYYRRASKGR